MIKNMLKLIIIMVIGILVVQVNAEEKISGKDKLFYEMDKCYKSNECLNFINVEIISKWYFPAEQGNSYGVFGFKFKNFKENKDEGEKEQGAQINQMMPRYLLYVRAYDIQNKTKDGKDNFLGFSANIPEQIEGSEDIFAFAFPAKVGNYKIITAITDSQYNILGIVSCEAEFPSFAASDKIISSSPIFLKRISTLQTVDSMFTVWKNLFHLGIGEIYPYFENKFKSDEQPTLFIQLFGLSLNQENSSYDIEYTLLIKKGDKEELKFKSMRVSSPGIVQPVLFKKEGKGLEVGDYLLELLIEDKVSGKKLQKVIPFSII